MVPDGIIPFLYCIVIAFAFMKAWQLFLESLQLLLHQLQFVA